MIDLHRSSWHAVMTMVSCSRYISHYVFRRTKFILVIANMYSVPLGIMFGADVSQPYSIFIVSTCWYILFTAYTGTIYSQVNNLFFFETYEKLTRVLGLFLLLFSGISSELCSSLCLRHTCTSVTWVPGDTGKRKMGKLV